MRKTIIAICVLLVVVQVFVFCERIFKKSYDISRIELTCYEYGNNSLIIRDKDTISKLIYYMLMARGEKEDNTELIYGGAYSFTIYYVNGDVFNFILWDREKYGTSKETIGEGYWCSYYDDMSEMYDYVMQIVSERKD